MSELHKRFYWIFFGATLVLLFFFHNLFGQVNDKTLLDRKINLNLKKVSLFQACATLANLEGIPLGLEGATDFKIEGKENLVIKSGTLKEILDSIVKQEPNYIWEVRDGVINFYPVFSRDKNIQTLLETKIKRFKLRKEEGRFGISEKINKLDEINKVLSSKQIKLNIGVRSKRNGMDATTDIDMSNTDLRGILNKIIKNNNTSKFWSINRFEDDGEGIFLAF